MLQGRVNARTKEKIMEDTIQKLRERVNGFRLLDGEDGRHFKIEKTIVSYLLAQYGKGDSLSKKALVELENYL